MVFWPSREDRIYSNIAAALKGEGIAEILEQSSGYKRTDVTTETDSPLLKFKKSIEVLKKNDNQRWLLIYVLANVAGPEAQKVVDAFPATLKELPPVDGNVSSAIEFLRKMELYPLSPGLKDSLRLKRSRFAEIARHIVTLFVYKSLHNSFLNLLFSVNIAEQLLAHPLPGMPPNFTTVASKIDEVVEKGRKDLGLLTVDAARIGTCLDELPALSDSLRKAVNPACASVVIADIRLFVRETLSRLNESVFAAANELSFNPWLSELPDKIQDSNEFKEFDQVIRDLTATIRARAFKHKMWLEAEAKLSSMGQSFGARKAAADVIEPWLTLSQNVEWLAALEGDAWAEDARKYGAGVEKEISKGEQLTEDIQPYFETYQRWFREPFSRIDSGLTADCGSVYRMDVPFSTIWKDLG
jgi:hypothetical protein